MFRCPVTDHGAQHGAGAEIAAHHDKRAHKHQGRAPAEVQHHIARHEKPQGGANGGPEAFFIVDSAVEGGEGRGDDDGRGEDQHIVA